MPPKVTISIIVAVAENNVIGHNNALPWHIKSEFDYFKRMTRGHPIVMGRKSFESFGSKPLPDRDNIIITRDLLFNAEGVIVAHSLIAAIDCAQKLAHKGEIFIGGGAGIYAEALKMADRLYFTRIHLTPEGDTHFPAVDWSHWRESHKEFHPAQEGEDGDYTVFVYERI